MKTNTVQPAPARSRANWLTILAPVNFSPCSIKALRCARELAGVKKVRSRLRSGHPVEEINRVARLEQADLIVIGTHGHSGPQHVVLGSVTERVVRRAPCPVLVVRERNYRP